MTSVITYKTETVKFDLNPPVFAESESSINWAAFTLDPVIPDSFWKGLADSEEGRLVDMEFALTTIPPNES